MNISEKELETMPVQQGFRLRGTQMTRLETFLDAAFAFATTMLVISAGEIPKNYPELILALKEIPSFLASFLIIMLFWIGHRTWSRRYGLEDMNTFDQHQFDFRFAGLYYTAEIDVFRAL